MRPLFFAMLLLLQACATAPRADSNVAVVWNRVEEPHRVCESLSGRKNLFHILGCSHWSGPATAGGPRTCSIYAPEPRHERNFERFATLGHELKHCFDGNWHDRWGRMIPPSENAAAGGSAAHHK